MANVLKDLFGGGKPAETNVPVADSDFADFAHPADPAPVPILSTGTFDGLGSGPTARPFTKWYNIHERHTMADFWAEGVILACIAVLVAVHLAGASLNRKKARKWIQSHKEPLVSEFALVGFSGMPPSAADETPDSLVKMLAENNQLQGDALLREKSLFEFATYATGRTNVAFMDVKLTLVKRFNLFTTLFESVMGFFVESMGQPSDTMEAVIYPFDGKEALTVPGLPGAAEIKAKDGKSTFDGFVWALVNKDRMKSVREDRYDVSLTFTKDNQKLPPWLTIMSESAEITDALLTPELIKAAESAGLDNFDYLIVSDQPTERPKTLDETTPRKRLFLKYRLPSHNDYTPFIPLFHYFMRLPDHLVQVAHFRAEVLRKVKATRDEAQKSIKKASEEEKAEERAAERERAKKLKRDQNLSALDAKAQKKFLDREREKELRKTTKKQTTRA